jgi:hypothetical protein
VSWWVSLFVVLDRKSLVQFCLLIFCVVSYRIVVDPFHVTMSLWCLCYCDLTLYNPVLVLVVWIGNLTKTEGTRNYVIMKHINTFMSKREEEVIDWLSYEKNTFILKSQRFLNGTRICCQMESENDLFKCCNEIKHKFLKSERAFYLLEHGFKPDFLNKTFILSFVRTVLVR